MGDCHDLYLKSDVLLLADVFKNFRKTCMQHYKLDPANYYTSPGLRWDAMLKSTGIELELMTDADMFHFIEKGMRGGISCITNRYGSANNKHMKNYDKSKPRKYLMYAMPTICMDGICPNIFQLVDSNGWNKRRYTSLDSKCT